MDLTDRNSSVFRPEFINLTTGRFKGHSHNHGHTQYNYGEHLPMNYIHYGSIELIHEQRIQDAIRADQLRQASSKKPHRITIALTNLRNLAATILIAAGEHVRQEPVRRPELDAKSTKATQRA